IDFFYSSRRRHTRSKRDWSSDVCSSDLEYHHNSPQIDELMKKMTVTEKQRYSEEYLEQDKRSIANSIQLVFKNGETSEEMEVEYPVGHKFRRDEVKPIIDQKFKDNLMSHFNESKTDELLNLFKDQDDLKSLSINEFWEHWIS